MSEENVLDMYEHVQQSNSGITTNDLDSKVKEMWEARLNYEEKKKISNDAHATFEKIKYELLEMLKLCGKDKYIVDGVGTVSKNIKKTVKVPKGLKEKTQMLKHFRELGEEVYLNMVTVHSATLNSYVKQKVEEDPLFELPGLESNVSEEIRFTKSRSKK